MTIRHRIEVESISLLVLAAIAGIAFAFYTGYRPNFENKFSLPIIENLQGQTIAPTPTGAPNPQEQSQISPDGKKVLTMRIKTNEDFTKTYTFISSNADGTDQKTIYLVTYSADSMSIPFNTWSPDNKYVFIKHTSPLGSDAIVLKANGEPVTESESAINTTLLFKDKIANNIYDDTTGWASETLLIINTKTSEGAQGTSYWFEIPSKAIIPLSTQF